MYKLKQPKQGVIQFILRDVHNPKKAHVFRIYKDRHFTYNQLIGDRLFYRSFKRLNRSTGYGSLMNNRMVRIHLKHRKEFR